MDAFLDVFFAIDKDNSETISIEELKVYMKENEMEDNFVDKWTKLFDPEHTGEITLTKFCDVLGLDIEEIRQMSASAAKQSAKPVNGAQKSFKDFDDVEVIVNDVSDDDFTTILNLNEKGMQQFKSKESDFVKWFKKELDEKLGRLWHVVMVRGQYHSYYSYVPGYSACYKRDGRIYIIFKTPSQ